MARIRTVKPEFWTSAQIAECSTNARLMFVGLWNFCDDYGVHPASEMRVKMEVFPSDTFNRDEIRRMIDELLANGLLHEYEVSGQRYWWVTGWLKHQNVESATGRWPMPDGKIGEKVRGRQNPDGYKRSAQDQKSLREHSTNISGTFDEHSGKVNQKEKEKEKEVNVNGDFDLFWKSYPVKKGKAHALKAWKSAKIGQNLSCIIDVLQKQVAACKDLKYFPHAATWLNGRRWEDEPEPTAQEQRKPDGSFDVDAWMKDLLS